MEITLSPQWAVVMAGLCQAIVAEGSEMGSDMAWSLAGSSVVASPPSPAEARCATPNAWSWKLMDLSVDNLPVMFLILSCLNLTLPVAETWLPRKVRPCILLHTSVLIAGSLEVLGKSSLWVCWICGEMYRVRARDRSHLRLYCRGVTAGEME